MTATRSCFTRGRAQTSVRWTPIAAALIMVAACVADPEEQIDASLEVPEACCVPTTCEAEGAGCGSIEDGCGGTLDCGTCDACGDGVCDGAESCRTCDADCGACPAVDSVCGDRVCGGAETCESCVGDCGSCPPTGNVYHVATTGDDARSCAEATDPATPKRNLMGAQGGIACLQTPGEGLLIREGVYEELINNFTDPFQWPSGRSWTEAFTVAAYPGESVTVRGIGIATDDVDHLWTVSYWIFQGLHAVNTWGGEAIWTRAPDHIRFIDMEATTASRRDQCIQGGGSFIEFIDIDVHDCGDPNMEACGGACGASYGFYWTGDDSLFERLRVHDTTGYGFHVFSAGCDDVTRNCPDRNVIRYSEIYRTGTRQGSAGILFAMGTGNEAYDNVVRDSDGGISVAYGASDTKILHNLVHANTYDGIQNGGGWGRTARNNKIENNIVVGNGGYGIVNSGAGTAEGEPVATSLRNNILFENGAGVDGLLDTATDAVVSGNLAVDPLFADAAANDFHLTECSPAIDAAVSPDEIEVDLDGVVRVDNAPDIGPYESTSPAGECR